MLAASRVNNLTSSDMKPWHIKASYQLLDDKGSVTDEGTYEELWVGPTKFKRTFSGKSFTQTDYGTDKGVMRSGSHEDVPSLLAYLRRELVAPLFSEEVIQRGTYGVKPVDVNGAKLQCLQLDLAPGNGITNCIGTDKPILRISDYAGDHLQILHNRILDYQNHYVAGDLKIVRGNQTLMTARIDSIEPFDTASESGLSPSSDAIFLPRRVTISAGIAVGMLLSHNAPAYPPAARAARVSGTVVLEALISINGTIKDLQVVQGPPELQQSAVDAVRTWRYRPYLLNGEPVEVRTTVNVVFTMNH